MSTLENAPSLEEQIAQWRNYLRRRQAIHSVDVAELEDHLRELIADLVGSGLTTDEAFLVAVKRAISTPSRGSSHASIRIASGSSLSSSRPIRKSHGCGLGKTSSSFSALRWLRQS